MYGPSAAGEAGILLDGWRVQFTLSLVLGTQSQEARHCPPSTQTGAQEARDS